MIDELEAHLRDEFARLVAGGVPPDEAWAKAVLAELAAKARLAVDCPVLAPGRPLPESFDWFSFRATTSPL